MLSEDGTQMWDGTRGEWIPTNVAKIEEPKQENAPTGKFMKLVKRFDSSPTAGAVALVCFGFLLLVFSEIYEYSAEYSRAPEVPDQDDYDLNDDGFLNATETVPYDSAVDAYEDELREFQSDRLGDQGKSILFSDIGPLMLCLGLLLFAVGKGTTEMPKSVRIIIVIFAFLFFMETIGTGQNLGVGTDFNLGFGLDAGNQSNN